MTREHFYNVLLRYLRKSGATYKPYVGRSIHVIDGTLKGFTFRPYGTRCVIEEMPERFSAFSKPKVTSYLDIETGYSLERVHYWLYKHGFLHEVQYKLFIKYSNADFKNCKPCVRVAV